MSPPSKNKKLKAKAILDKKLRATLSSNVDDDQEEGSRRSNTMEKTLTSASATSAKKTLVSFDGEDGGSSNENQRQENERERGRPPLFKRNSSNNVRHKRNRSVSRSTIPLMGPITTEISSTNNEGPPITSSTATTVNAVSNHAMKMRTTRVIKKTRSRRKEYMIRSMKMKDIAAVYQLGNSIFTASEFPNMYRTWDDFAVVANFEGSPEFCFVVETSTTPMTTTKLTRTSANGEQHTTTTSSTTTNNGSEQQEQPKEIIGFLLGDSMTKSNIGTRGYIQWVAVEPAYRRLGIATCLLNKFTEVAQTENISLLLADTPADNTPAIRLFEKAGLRWKKDHVYLTKQLKDVETEHLDEDGYYDFYYTAKGHRIRIRPMEIEDLHPIYKIGEDIFTSKSSNLFHFWDETVVMHSYLSDPEYCIAATIKDDDGEEKVIGFAFGTTIEKPRSSWRYGYLVWLGCHREFQGLGLAYQIYNVMVELFATEKVRMLMVDTQQNNEGALHFFRKLGFGHDEEHVYLSNGPTSVIENFATSSKPNKK